MILQRYIASRLVQGWVLALVVLVPVFAVIGFIEELERTRLGYNALAVARYTLLTLPQQVLALAPVIALLGSMAALSGLYRTNELTVMSAAGFPPAGLLRAVARPTFLFMLLLWLGMELVAPRLQLVAEQQRQTLRYGEDLQIPEGGIWSIDGRRYTRLGRITRDGVPGDIDVFQFDDERHLLHAVHGAEAIALPDRRWLLRDVREKSLVDGQLVTGTRDEMEVANLWARKELPTLSFSSETMTLSVLYSYGHYLARSGQPSGKSLALFWQKVLMPITVAAMVLLAIPLSASSGASRDLSMGLKLGVGALIGILFFLAAQIIHALGQLLGLNPATTALLPALIILTSALFLLRRMRW